MMTRLEIVSEASPHFAKVTSIISRAVFSSIVTECPLSFPPILLLSPPGIGKTFYCRSLAQALGTTCVPISINGTSDRGQLGGLTPLWRGAKLGRIAQAILIDSMTASPLFLLDELDKSPTLSSDEGTLNVLLSVLEDENASAFVDEYLGLPIAAQFANWIASANTTQTISAPLIDRMLVIEIAAPTGDHARRVVRSIAADLIKRRAPNLVGGVADEAVERLAGMNARTISRVVDLAIAFTVARRRRTVSADDVERAVELVQDPRPFTKMGFLAR
ncbi:AAA family ATPase [Beijerinckia sp. L45]|uniref:AAA family ATPase n=1 Tax=Beijerinckia sp. L45 TaxID=1641855 RepID=UPI00131E4AB6|nr:AAA family ATPase [Beijerinckia sp. L45]